MAYCTKDDLTDIMSEEGIQLQTMDTGEEPFNDDAKVANAISRATVRMKQYIQRKYDTAALNNSNDWVRWCSGTIACVMLMRRRGNGVPAGLQESYDDFMEWLRLIFKGQAEIPDAIPRYEPGIAMSNLVFDPRFVAAKIRARPSLSTGDQSGKKIRYTDQQDTNAVF